MSISLTFLTPLKRKKVFFCLNFPTICRATLFFPIANEMELKKKSKRRRVSCKKISKKLKIQLKIEIKIHPVVSEIDESIEDFLHLFFFTSVRFHFIVFFRDHSFATAYYQQSETTVRNI